MEEYLTYLTHLEAIKAIDVGIVKRTKLDEALEAISKLTSISNKQFQEFRRRSTALLQVYLSLKETELYVSEDCRKPCTADSHGLEEGMIVTVEPGIYFSRYALSTVYLRDPVHSKFINKEVLERYLPVGGVRIEDDILITAKGYENITTAPKGEEMLDIIREGYKKKSLWEYDMKSFQGEGKPTHCTAYLECLAMEGRKERGSSLSRKHTIEKKVGFGTVSLEAHEQSRVTDTEPTSAGDEAEQHPTTLLPPPLPQKAPLLPPKPLAYTMSVPDLKSTLGSRSQTSPDDPSVEKDNRIPTQSFKVRYNSVTHPSGSTSKNLHRSKSMVKSKSVVPYVKT